MFYKRSTYYQLPGSFNAYLPIQKAHYKHSSHTSMATTVSIPNNHIRHDRYHHNHHYNHNHRYLIPTVLEFLLLNTHPQPPLLPPLLPPSDHVPNLPTTTQPRRMGCKETGSCTFICASGEFSAVWISGLGSNVDVGLFCAARGRG